MRLCRSPTARHDVEGATYVDLIKHEAAILDDPAPGDQPLSADPDDEYLVDLARAAAAHVLV